MAGEISTAAYLANIRASLNQGGGVFDNLSAEQRERLRNYPYGTESFINFNEFNQDMVSTIQQLYLDEAQYGAQKYMEETGKTAEEIKAFHGASVEDCVKAQAEGRTKTALAMIKFGKISVEDLLKKLTGRKEAREAAAAKKPQNPAPADTVQNPDVSGAPVFPKADLSGYNSVDEARQALLEKYNLPQEKLDKVVKPIVDESKKAGLQGAEALSFVNSAVLVKLAGGEAAADKQKLTELILNDKIQNGSIPYNVMMEQLIKGIQAGAPMQGC